MENVDSERIGIFGHCWGGRVSWLGAGTNSKYKACAVFYGGRIKKTMGENNPPAIDLAPNNRLSLAFSATKTRILPLRTSMTIVGL